MTNLDISHHKSREPRYVALSCLFICLFLASVMQVGDRQPLPADRRPVGAAPLPRSLQAICGLLPVQRGELVAVLHPARALVSSRR